MPREFKSIYAGSINELISVNNSMGIKFEGGISSLHQVDDFAFATKQTSEGITKEFAELWFHKREGESSYSRYRRVLYMAKLSNFLNDTGIGSFVPELPRKPRPTFVPHIFPPEEINRLFAVSEQLRLEILARDSTIFSIPALLRVLYGTGLRLVEAKKLTDDDVNLKEGWIHVEISKNGKERTIPISKSLKEVLEQYLRYRDLLPLKERSGVFFIKLNGEKIKNRARDYFIECLNMAGIRYEPGPGPRLHDLRHTFAVNAVINMVNRGIDVNVFLPVLSAYLGHNTFESTLYYIRVTSQLYPEIFKEIDKKIDVYPKILKYENA